MSEEHVIETGAASLRVEQLGAAVPTMSDLMVLLGRRVWTCYYAAKARNKPLATFMLAEAVNVMERSMFLAPRYAQTMEAYLEFEVAHAREALESEDWEAFERLVHKMVDRANAYHELFDRGFIRWQIPSAPPPDLDVTPRD